MLTLIGLKKYGEVHDSGVYPISRVVPARSAVALEKHELP
jgi:hypothetical protein